MKKMFQASLKGIVAVTAAAAALIVASCGNLTTSTSSTFTSLYTNVFKACGQCHAPGKDAYVNNNVMLDFSTQATAYSSLTTLTPIGTLTQSDCSGAKYVQPNSSALSMIWPEITGTQSDIDAFQQTNPNCGINTIPHENLGISADQQTALKTWINAGALNN